MEHFVTLFDSNYLLQGLALHRSLESQGEPFVLWVVCMDENVERAIISLGYPSLKAIALTELESLEPRLLDVKPLRSRGEYCWTLTPFTYAAVHAKDAEIKRVTYVDADLYFWGPASALLDQMDRTGADVMLTEHAYAPEYRQEALAGVYCVQFLPFAFNASGIEILSWWQERCLEWCYARFEGGRFGDQKYLDDWLVRWGKQRVAVLEDKSLTLAPWNIDHIAPESPRGIYHFHGLRIYSNERVRLWSCYRIGKKNRLMIYEPYLSALGEIRKMLMLSNLKWTQFEVERGITKQAKKMGRIFLKRNEVWASF